MKKRKNLSVVVLYVRIAIPACTLGYPCRFLWYNFGKGMDGGGYELCLRITSVGVKKIQKEAKRESIHRRRN